MKYLNIHLKPMTSLLEKMDLLQKYFGSTARNNAGIKKHLERSLTNPEIEQTFTDNWNQYYPEFIKEYEQVLEELKADPEIPKATKATQVSMLSRSVNLMKELNTFEKYREFKLTPKE